MVKLISERTRQEIGRITLGDSGEVSTTGAIAAGVFRQQKRRHGNSDAEAFQALATGWSNGYVTILALTKS